MVPERTRTSQKTHQSGSFICKFWHQSVASQFLELAGFKGFMVKEQILQFAIQGKRSGIFVGKGPILGSLEIRANWGKTGVHWC